MDPNVWKIVNFIDMEDLEDGSEIIWERRIPIYDKVKKPYTKKGKLCYKRVEVLTGFKYEPYRTRLSKFHHKTVSGYIPCLVADPSPEFPYPVPWLDDWIYAYGGANESLYIRREK